MPPLRSCAALRSGKESATEINESVHARMDWKFRELRIVSPSTFISNRVSDQKRSSATIARRDGGSVQPAKVTPKTRRKEVDARFVNAEGQGNEKRVKDGIFFGLDLVTVGSES